MHSVCTKYAPIRLLAVKEKAATHCKAISCGSQQNQKAERGGFEPPNAVRRLRFSRPVQSSENPDSKALPRKDIGTTRALRAKATGPELAPVAEDRSEAVPVSVADLKRFVARCQGLPEHVRTTLATILQTVEP